MIRKYSNLVCAATEQEQLKHFLELFRKRYEKRQRSGGGFSVFDPDVVTLDIQRWQHAKRKNLPGIKPTIERYKTHEELHDAMVSFRTEEEIRLESEQDSESGTKVLFETPPYVTYEASTPQALSKLSQGSRWCTQNVVTAKAYLTKRGPFQIVRKENKPLFAITGDQVWYFTDYELRHGTNYSGNQSTPYVLRQDFDTLNKILSKLGQDPVSIKSTKRGELVIVSNTHEIQARVDTALKEGNLEELRRALLNIRDFPMQLPPDLTIKESLNLEGTNLSELPPGLTVWGNLNLIQTKIKKIPPKLYVAGDLFLNETPLEHIAEGLTVEGSFSVTATKIRKLPSGLKVGGDFYAMEMPQLRELPSDIEVGGGFHLRRSGVESIPEHITKIYGTLNLESTPIRKLPQWLKEVKGSLFLNGASIEELPPTLTSVGNHLQLSQTQIKSLPQGLTVKASLSLKDTPVLALPSGLSVDGSLDLIGTSVTSLPSDLKVRGMIYGTNPKQG